jgi:mono/diheme cytochrome c family protein
MKRSQPLFVLAALATVATATHAENPTPSAAPSGQAIFEHWCAPCHAPGPGHPGTQSLQVKYGGKISPVLLERTDLSAQVVATFVRHGVLSMPPFRKTEITDADLAALAAYVSRSFKGS